jgi:ubiquinone/menaquinone biosynthesis C-methylase UbiE
MASERVYMGNEIRPQERLHLDRYSFALNQLRGGERILDAACGSGYGTDLVARQAASVIGIDISDHAIAYAKKHHQRGNIEFRQADLRLPLALPDEHFTVVISIETLEHVADQDRILAEFWRVLAPGGRIIISTPDREVISEKARELNEFHISELSKKEFIVLLSRYFHLQSLHGQVPFSPSLRKRIIKLLAKLDVLKLRRLILGSPAFVRVLHPVLSFGPSVIEPISAEGPGQHYYLIAIATK